MLHRNSPAGTAAQKCSKSSFLQRPAIILAMLLLCAVLSSCRGQYSKDRIAKVYDMETHIGMDDYQRKRTGYDSIQLLVEKGKITANFCYPNNWFMQRDTVYTSDTAYKKWWQVIRLTPNIMLATRNDTTTTFRNGFIDMRKGYYDSIIVQNYKINVTKVEPEVK